MLGAVIAVNAQDSTSNKQGAGSSGYNTERDNYTDKEAIASTELPSLVTEQLQGQDYTGWTAGQAFRKEKDGKTVYAVELMKGDEKKMVKFDAQGNKIKEKKKD
jgi:uncharacterized membrane protein YkoI